jgi:hypothetical protein
MQALLTYFLDKDIVAFLSVSQNVVPMAEVLRGNNIFIDKL